MKMFWQHFCCHYGIWKIKRFFVESPKLFTQSPWNFLDIVLLVSVLKGRCDHGLLFSTQILCHILSAAVHVMWEWHQKSFFDFTEIVNNHRLKQQTTWQFVRFISHFSRKFHIAISKYLNGIVLFRIGSDYYKK